uniref:Ig-like domain-containing protein n=1 Tax=Macrostomum lignano TaxID=282301 RepID=A0A1I8F8R0_9PLAT
TADSSNPGQLVSSPSSPAARAQPWPKAPSWAPDLPVPWRQPPRELNWLRLRRGVDSAEVDAARRRGQTGRRRRLSWALSRSDLLMAASNGVEWRPACVPLPAPACKYHPALRVSHRSLRCCLRDRVEFNCTAEANPTARVYIVRGNSTVSAVAPRSVSHAIALGIEERQRQLRLRGGDQPAWRRAAQGATAVLPGCPLPARAVNQTVAWRVCGVNSDSDFSGLGGGRQPAGDRLSVSANPPPTSVQWRLSGSADGNSSSGRVLLLEPVARAHAGLWVCEARSSAATTAGAGGDAGQPMRREFSARRSGPPPAAPVLAGHPASLVCQPSTTRPWRPGARVPLVPLLRRQQRPGAPGPVADSAVQPGRLSDSGRYYCTPENSVGRGPASSVALEVVQSPTWLTTSAWPTRRRRRGGGGLLRLDCSTLAKPEALTRWFKNGVEIRQADAAATTAIEEGYDPARHISTGALRFNRLGPEDSAAIAPEILTDTAKTALQPAVSASSSVSLECLVDAQPEPTVTWELLAGTGGADRQQLVGNLTPESRHRRFATGNPAGGESGRGRYACRRETGWASRVVNPGPPEPPTNLTVESTGWDHVLLTWRPGFDGGLPANYSVVFASTSDVASRFGIASTSHTGRFFAGQFVDDVGAEVTRVGAVRQRDGAAAGDRLRLLGAGRQLSRRQRRPAHGRLDCQRHHPGAAAAGGRRRQGRHRRFDAAFRRAARWALRSGGGLSRRRHRVESLPQLRASEPPNGISFVNSYRLSACLLARPIYLPTVRTAVWAN